MIIPDKKKVATVILAGLKPHDEEPEKKVSSVPEGLKSSAEDILSAIENKSAESLAQALQSFWDQCESYEPSDPSE